LQRLHACGYTHSKVAAALGVTPALVSMWFNGKRKASAQYMTALRKIDERATTKTS
jgi:predicted transcriptional regulator